MPRHLKRILTDIAGYFLILAGIATGWLPGPGGIPLVLAGLGLLSIHNQWAKNIRLYLEENGSKLIKIAFPDIPVVQLLYDILTLVIWATAGWLGYRHAALWQISLAIALFCIGLVIFLINRDRWQRLRHKQA